MFRFIWMAIWLFYSWSAFASDPGDVTGFIKGSKPPIKLQQQNQTEGLNIATIGTDGNCTYQTGAGVIQTAIDAGYDEIRLVKGTHMGNIEISDKNVNFKGQYLNCLLALNDVPSNFVTDTSIISGLTGAAMPAIRILGNNQRNFVLFKNVHISNGEPATNSTIRGGGIDVYLADLSLTLDTVQIINNQGTQGGGLSVRSGTTNVFMIDSLIALNNAEDGGGIYCFGSSETINMRDRGPENPSGVSLNEATNGDGGGLYIDANCEFTSTSGSYGSGDFDVNGIVLNSATGHGGGVYVDNGAEVRLDGAQRCNGSLCSGNNDSNVRVTANSAGSDSNVNANGGGVYVTGVSTVVRLVNAIITDNSATRYGGGLVAANRGQIYMSSFYTNSLPDQCWSPGSCSQITGNEAGSSGGGVRLETGGYVNLDRSVITANSAPVGTALNVSSASALSIVDLTGSLIANNGIGSNDIAVLLGTDGQLFMSHSTLADNNVISQVILAGEDALLDVRSSIIHQADGKPVYAQSGTPLALNAECIMVSSLDDFNQPGQGLVLIDDPEFINRGTGDFHLSDGSPAIDACLDTGFQPFDVDQDIRGWDDPAVTNAPLHTFDMGYDENFRLIADLIFKDGFEELP